MDAQRGLSVSGHRNTVLCLHLTSDTYHVTPSGRAPRARGKFWIRRVKLRIFRPDPKSHKSEGFPAAQIFKTHKSQNTYCRSAHFSKAVKIVGAQNPRGTLHGGVPRARRACRLKGSNQHVSARDRSAAKCLNGTAAADAQLLQQRSSGSSTRQVQGMPAGSPSCGFQHNMTR